MGIRSWLSVLVDTLSRAFSGPLLELRSPEPEEQVEQPWGTNWCGPAVAVTLHRVLVGSDYPLETAKRELLGTWRDGSTSLDALDRWFNYRGMRAATIMVPASALFEAVTVALRGGAYVVPLIYTSGWVNMREPGATATHFLICYASRGARLFFSDSLSRGADSGMWDVSERDFEDRWAARVTRFAELTPMILVRKS